MHERRFSGEVERLRSPERLTILETNKIIKLSLEGIAAKSLLDIGTGSGLFAEEFSKKDLNVAGIDVSEEMIKAAKEFVPKGNFKLAVAEEIPFEDKSFDASFFGLVFHEVDDMLKALLEAKRVSNKRVLILEWQYKAGEYGPPLEHRVKPEQMSKVIKDAGFKNYDKIELKELVLYRLNL